MQTMKHKKREPVLDEDQKRFLLKNHKTLSLQSLAKHFGITEDQTKTQCSMQQCGYFSEGATQ